MSALDMRKRAQEKACHMEQEQEQEQEQSVQENPQAAVNTAEEVEKLAGSHVEARLDMLL